MGCKRKNNNKVKADQTTTKKTKKLDTGKRRKARMKTKSDKFFIDLQESKTTPVELSTTTTTTTKETSTKNTLGYDELGNRERELVLDLFGFDTEPLNVKVEAPFDDQEENDEVKVKTEVGEDPSESSPDDSLDTHYLHNDNVKRPAWTDEDDNDIRVRDVVKGMGKARGSRGIREESEQKYSQTLQQKFTQTMGETPSWATLSEEDRKPSIEEDLLKSTGDYLSHGRSSKLSKKRLDFKREMDLNYTSRTEGAVITAAEFNPKHHMALVGGFSRNVVGAASLFKVDGTYNHLIHSVKFPKFPVKFAKFLSDGGRFVAGSNQCNYFYMYDLEAAQETRIPSNLGKEGHNLKNVIVSPDEELLVFIGKSGQLYLYDANCLSYVDTLHATGEVTSAAFNSSGSRLYAHTSEGNVCIMDMNSRSCVHQFYDDGCIGGTSIAVSPSNQYLACGSSSGVVNMYDLADVTSHSPVPIKVLTKLKTSVSRLAFNSSSEILATVSNQLENAIKLAHLPSMTYFENFPDPRSKMQFIQVINFSPQSGFMALGNNSGRVFLYRLHNFTNY